MAAILDRGEGRGISFVYLTGRTGAIVYDRVNVAKRTACALRASYFFFFGVGNCRLKRCRRLGRILRKGTGLRSF